MNIRPVGILTNAHVLNHRLDPRTGYSQLLAASIVQIMEPLSLLGTNRPSGICLIFRFARLTLGLCSAYPRTGLSIAEALVPDSD